jgi:hypothetical protein
MAQRYRFHSSAARVRRSLPGAFENDALVAVPIAAGYRQPFKPPTNLRGSSCEEPQGGISPALGADLPREPMPFSEDIRPT